jgi:hypothetical protein
MVAISLLFLATPSLASDEDIKEIQKDFRVKNVL